MRPFELTRESHPLWNDIENSSLRGHSSVPESDRTPQHRGITLGHGCCGFCRPRYQGL